MEETSDKLGAVTFVDKEVAANWDRLWIRRKDVNRKYVLGLKSQPKKIRYPEFLGRGFTRPRKIKAWMRSTMFAELSSEIPESRTLGTLRCMAELQLQGYPNQLLKDLVASISQRPLRTLRPLRRHPKRRPPSPPCCRSSLRPSFAPLRRLVSFILQ